jgi:hypothetical protein
MFYWTARPVSIEFQTFLSPTVAVSANLEEFQFGGRRGDSKTPGLFESAMLAKGANYISWPTRDKMDKSGSESTRRGAQQLRGAAGDQGLNVAG